MQRIAVRLFGASMLAVVLFESSLAMAWAVPTPRPVPTRAGAVAVFYRSTASFLVLKAFRVGPYDWTDDGCSVPDTLKVSVPALAFASKRFASECAQHDFAYRNFGARLRLDPTQSRRESVDRFFYARLKDRCHQRDIVRAHRKTLCLTYARVFYVAVRTFGRL